jgi:hypothetical protein
VNRGPSTVPGVIAPGSVDNPWFLRSRRRSVLELAEELAAEDAFDHGPTVG